MVDASEVNLTVRTLRNRDELNYITAQPISGLRLLVWRRYCVEELLERSRVRRTCLFLCGKNIRVERCALFDGLWLWVGGEI